MKPRRLLAFALVLLLLPLQALASNFYLFPDSNRRLLTEEELWEWQYDVLGYGFNELFARYGRPFITGSKYDVFFNCQTWYRTDPYYPGDGPVLSSLEWDNYRLFKAVRAQMRALGTTNPGGKPLPRVYDDRIASPLPGFFETYFKPNQQLKVYDGPGTHYRRGAGGKAMCSTNGRVYAAGWEDGWLMILYELNSGGVRVGFASARDFVDQIDLRPLSFNRMPTTVFAQATVTEDPVRALTPIARLGPGSPVTWLSRYYHRDMNWDYIEFTSGNQLMRGFVPEGSLMPILDEEPLITK